MFTGAKAAYPLLELRRFAGAPSSAGSALTATGSALTATDGARFRFPGDETDDFFDKGNCEGSSFSPSASSASSASRGDDDEKKVADEEIVASSRAALENALDAADAFFALETAAFTTHGDDDSNPNRSDFEASRFDAKRRLSAARRARRELADAADAFFALVREEEEDDEDFFSDADRGDDATLGDERDTSHREMDGARASALVLELEDRVAELERDLAECARGEKGSGGAGGSRFSGRVEL